jgi:hypothetical protein
MTALRSSLATGMEVLVIIGRLLYRITSIVEDIEARLTAPDALDEAGEEHG